MTSALVFSLDKDLNEERMIGIIVIKLLRKIVFYARTGEKTGPEARLIYSDKIDLLVTILT